MNTEHYLALDLGASSGRAVIGSFDGSTLTMTEIHRFSNDPVQAGGTLYWDVLRLLHEIKTAIRKAAEYHIRGIGIDTWGVDFGLLSSRGKLLGNPVHYRDLRTRGMCKEAESCITPEELYRITGNQIMEINTAFQLYAMLHSEPETLASAETLLMMPDLLAYFLTGQYGAERSIVSTTQLCDQRTGSWSPEIAEMFGAQQRMLLPVTEPGTFRGMLSDAVCAELGIEPVPVYAVCGHDTQSAMAAVPAQEEPFVFLSCGTWSLLGTELDAPVLTEQARRADFTNEAGFGGKTAFLKNITGLWILQACKRFYARSGNPRSYAEMEQLARDAGECVCRIDPNDPRFSTDGDIPQRVRAFCAETDQPVPDTDGAVLRCIYESLAQQYAHTIGQLADITGIRAEKLYVIGGGTKDALLMERTAAVCGIPVVCCGTEATAMGNLGIQLCAAGRLSGLSELRALVRRSQDIPYRRETSTC